MNTSSETFTLLSPAPLGFLLVGIIGTLANSLVIVVFIGVPSMLLKLTNIYILNQSLIDGTLSIILIGTSVREHMMFAPSDFDGKVLFCRLILSRVFLWSLLYSSSYNLIIMSLEKYVAICHPFKHERFFSRNRVYVTLVIAWMFGLIWGMQNAITTVYIDGRCMFNSVWLGHWKEAFAYMNLPVQLVVPVAVMGYVYFAIAKTISNSMKVGLIAISRNDVVIETVHKAI
ncbi:galanin receptor 2a-like [Tubulanus polymorphus]|uniref:galanin receptor 2a-like n=1 Tax=Tubulanus polymorphus TaxID=672921 RepID=UPI003DA34FDB